MRRFGLAAAALFLGACTVVTTPGATTTIPVSTTTAAPADAATGSALFRTCMTTAGHEVGEISIDENGRPNLAALVSETATTPEFRAALTACAPLISSFLSVEQSPGMAAMVRDQLSRFAECMRASGVEDFPEPASDEGAVPFPSGEIPFDDPEFAIAVEACAAAMAVVGS